MNINIIIVAFICSLSYPSYTQNSSKDNIVGQTISIQSKILNDEREIQVFLPGGYANSDEKYPVIYILDGQRYFLHGVSLQKSFVDFEQTPEFIVVGIAKNASDRNRNFSVNAEMYMDFIKSEIIQYVDTAFRTSENRMLFGWAYGGGFVIEALTKEPELFDTYIAASPFPLEDKIIKMDSLLKKFPMLNKVLYFTSGTDEGAVKEGTKELNVFLINNAPKTLDWTFKELEGEEHRSTPYTTLYHGIKKRFKYYPELQFNSLEEFLNAGGLAYVYDYYRERARRFDFSKELSDWTMFSLTRNAMRANDYNQVEVFINEFDATGFLERLSVSRSCSIAEFYLEHEQYDKARDLFKRIAKRHPTAAMPISGLGKTYEALNKEKQASEYFKKANELRERNSN